MPRNPNLLLKIRNASKRTITTLVLKKQRPLSMRVKLDNGKEFIIPKLETKLIRSAFNNMTIKQLTQMSDEEQRKQFARLEKMPSREFNLLLKTVETLRKRISKQTAIIDQIKRDSHSQHTYLPLDNAIKLIVLAKTIRSAKQIR
jgi:hypothetical protein